MSGQFVLDWAALAVSLVNTILCLWLGLTVLLNADRPRWGIWLAGGGLLLGGVFFLGHTAILGLGLDLLGAQMELWWRLTWVPVLLLPLAWYAVVLWYSGFFEQPRPPLFRRHRLWFALAFLLLTGVLGTLLLADPLPSFIHVLRLEFALEPVVIGLPVLVLTYAVYVLLCMSLALDALRHPGPSRRWMGAIARRRARPWLVATSLTLLLVGLLVSGVMLWLASRARQPPPGFQALPWIATFDMAIAALIAVSLVLLGQAVVSYEVFTGHTLPRRGLLRQWRRVVIFAFGYALTLAWVWASPLASIYSLLLSTLLLAAFFALLSWRSFSDRERSMQALRPFLLSQRLYDHLVSPPSDDSPVMDFSQPFEALCANVLDASRAYLVALGPLSPLVGQPLVYPPGAAPDLPGLATLRQQVTDADLLLVQVTPERFGGAAWAVPLWSERGLIGALLLGPKQGGGVYTREEIEIARLTGERLIDAHASAVMAGRLMALQRQRATQARVLDQQPRRVLHDEILPQIHTALLSLQTASGAGGLPEAEASQVLETLSGVHRQIAGLLQSLPAPAAPQVERLGLIPALRAMLEGEMAGAFDSLSLRVTPQAEHNAHRVPPTNAEVLYHAAREVVRNAAHHGRGPGGDRPLNLRVDITWNAGLRVLIEDDGVGMVPGEMWARGQGLALHSTMMAVVGGSLTIESVPGDFTRVVLQLPP